MNNWRGKCNDVIKSDAKYVIREVVINIHDKAEELFPNENAKSNEELTVLVNARRQYVEDSIDKLVDFLTEKAIKE